MLFVRLVRVSISFARGKCLHGRIVSLRKEVWAYTVSLIRPLVIEVPMKVSGHVFVC